MRCGLRAQHLAMHLFFLAHLVVQCRRLRAAEQRKPTHPQGAPGADAQTLPPEGGAPGTRRRQDPGPSRAVPLAFRAGLA